MKPRIKFPRSEKVYLPGTLYPRTSRSYAQSGTSAQYDLCQWRESD